MTRICVAGAHRGCNGSYHDIHARACPGSSASVSMRECERVHARACPRERVHPHVPLGALGVAVVWPGFSRHTPISTLPGASLGATAICLMRRCGILLRTLGRPSMGIYDT